MKTPYLVRKGIKVLKDEGPRGFLSKSKRFFVRACLELLLHMGQEGDLVPKYFKVALDTDWRKVAKPPARRFVNFERLTINWVVPEIGESGGFRTIFRFVKSLAERGHKVRVYEMPLVTLPRPVSETKRFIARMFGDIRAEIYAGVEGMAPADATFATSWHTAYPVFEFPHTLKKFYFVQDFEPFFHPLGSESVLAENTYRLGLHSITAGRWLSEKLSREYETRCDHFNLAVDHKTYFNKRKTKRDRVFFYARPATPRRAFELGVKALEIFAKRNPKFEIIFAGQRFGGIRFNFPVTNCGYVSESELNDIYNECAVALVISLSNYSLLPLEIMATGCPVVTNFGENNERNLPKGAVIYSRLSPFHLAQALENVVRRKDWIKISRRSEKLAKKFNWEDQFEKVETVIKESLKEAGLESLGRLKSEEKEKFKGKISASVVIPTFNGERYIKEVLDSVFRQKTDFKYEVIVIDSGSKDKTVEIVKKYPVRLAQIPNREFNHGRTRNLGVKISNGRYVAFLTQDAAPSGRYWLQRLVDAFYLDENVGAVYGPHLPRPDCDPVTRRELIDFFGSMSLDGKPEVQYIKPGAVLKTEDPVGFLSDVNSCLKKEIWKKIPYKALDYAEDQAMGRDLLRAGYKKVYEPGAAVIHSHTYPLFEYFRRQFDEYRGLKKAIGYVSRGTLWRIPLGTIKGTLADAKCVVKQEYTMGEKIKWVNRALWMNLFRRLAIYFAAKEGILPQRLRNRFSLEYKWRKVTRRIDGVD